ncbi:MAG: flaR [Paenibacillaceae bacterium]|nr:flaR [Paenibacillaceae bacterium]
MPRIMVTGVSSGVGKSTFARQLGEALHLPVTHLDSLYWMPGWVEAPREQFAASQREVAAREQWIIEGNYNSTYTIRSARADTIIYLELPLRVCLYRVLRRWWINRGRTRPDLGEGCEEKIDWPFLKFILTTYYSRKKGMERRFSECMAANPELTIVRLKSKREIQAYLVSHMKQGN